MTSLSLYAYPRGLYGSYLCASAAGSATAIAVSVNVAVASILTLLATIEPQLLQDTKGLLVCWLSMNPSGFSMARFVLHISQHKDSDGKLLLVLRTSSSAISGTNKA